MVGSSTPQRCSLFLVSADPLKIERGLVLASPFAKALILELATIIFFRLALGHSKSTVT